MTIQTLYQKYKNEPFVKFVKLVRSRKNPFGNLVVLAVKRFVEDLKNKDLVFDFEEGKRIVKFFELCHHWKGTKKGQPLELEPHQQFYIIQQFGWYTKSGRRRFRAAYKEVARKNGKTTECAGKGLWFLSKDGVNGAQVFCGATKEEQAKILINDAGKIAEASPYLRDVFKTYYNLGVARRVVYEEQGAFMAPLGRDSKREDGLDPQAGFIDEYHAHPSDEVLNVIESGMGAREQPMLDIITTAGFNQEGPCFRFRKHCIDILNGIKKDDSLLILIFALDKEDDWKDPKNFIKANPNLGVSVTEEYLKNRLAKAIGEGGEKEVDFKTKNLNYWTDSSDTWLSNEIWEANGSEPKEHEYWFMGVDLAATQDINAVVLFSEPDENGEHSVIPFFFVSEEKVNKMYSDGITSYRDWAASGNLIVTDGNVADHDAIQSKIFELCKLYDVQMIEFDRWNAHTMVTGLLDEGLPVEYYGQGYKDQNPSCKMLEKLILDKKIRHGNHPVLRWMNSNVTLKRDPAGSIKMDKSKSINKIDGMYALSNAIGGYMTWVENGGVPAKPTIEVW